MPRKLIPWLLIFASIQGCSVGKLQRKLVNKSSPYEQVDFHALIRRYMKKDKLNSIEGIYTVSGQVIKKGKGFLGNTAKEKTIERRDNYAKVAILRDPGGTGREFIELSLDKDDQTSYSIIGEFNSTESGSLLLYKHMTGKGKSNSYNFTTENGSDILEGIRVESEGGTTVTYKLTYVKLSTQ